MTFTDEELEALTTRIQNAGTEVVNAKAGAVSVPFCLRIAKFLLLCFQISSFNILWRSFEW